MRFAIIFILALCLHLFSACDRDGLDNEAGKLLSHTMCKNEKTLEADSNQSCVEYTYNASEETLTLKHINAGFNCCPDKLYCDIRIENDTIYLEESERKQDCLCMCLYDMTAEVYGLKAQRYTVKYIEPYLGDAEALVFQIDLENTAIGTYCVERTNYPWGI